MVAIFFWHCAESSLQVFALYAWLFLVSRFQYLNKTKLRGFATMLYGVLKWSNSITGKYFRERHDYERILEGASQLSADLSRGKSVHCRQIFRRVNLIMGRHIGKNFNNGETF